MLRRPGEGGPPGAFGPPADARAALGGPLPSLAAFSALQRMTCGLRALYDGARPTPEGATRGPSPSAAARRGAFTLPSGDLDAGPHLPLLGGRYRYLRTIGQGASALVLQAEDTFRAASPSSSHSGARGRGSAGGSGGGGGCGGGSSSGGSSSGRARVVIKAMRAPFWACGLQEARLLRYLNAEDPADACHCVRLLTAFDFAGHACLVMESLHESLLDYLRAEAPALPHAAAMHALRKIALQLLAALAFLARRGVVHADVKPENVLFVRPRPRPVRRGPGAGGAPGEAASGPFGGAGPSGGGVGVKLVDFGNAFRVETAPAFFDDFDVQTLNYRAPEVLFGAPFGCQIDAWSLGCVLAELAMARPLFVGDAPAALAAQMARALGPPPAGPPLAAGRHTGLLRRTREAAAAEAAGAEASAAEAAAAADEARRGGAGAGPGPSSSALAAAAHRSAHHHHHRPSHGAPMPPPPAPAARGAGELAAPLRAVDPALAALVAGLLCYDPAERWSPQEALRGSAFCGAALPLAELMAGPTGAAAGMRAGAGPAGAGAGGALPPALAGGVGEPAGDWTPAGKGPAPAAAATAAAAATGGLSGATEAMGAVGPGPRPPAGATGIPPPPPPWGDGRERTGEHAGGEEQEATGPGGNGLARRAGTAHAPPSADGRSRAAGLARSPPTRDAKAATEGGGDASVVVGPQPRSPGTAAAAVAAAAGASSGRRTAAGPTAAVKVSPSAAAATPAPAAAAANISGKLARARREGPSPRVAAAGAAAAIKREAPSRSPGTGAGPEPTRRERPKREHAGAGVRPWWEGAGHRGGGGGGTAAAADGEAGRRRPGEPSPSPAARKRAAPAAAAGGGGAAPRKRQRPAAAHGDDDDDDDDGSSSGGEEEKDEEEEEGEEANRAPAPEDMEDTPPAAPAQRAVSPPRPASPSLSLGTDAGGTDVWRTVGGLAADLTPVFVAHLPLPAPVRAPPQPALPPPALPAAGPGAVSGIVGARVSAGGPLLLPATYRDDAKAWRALYVRPAWGPPPAPAEAAPAPRLAPGPECELGPAASLEAAVAGDGDAAREGSLVGSRGGEPLPSPSASGRQPLPANGHGSAGGGGRASLSPSPSRASPAAGASSGGAGPIEERSWGRLPAVAAAASIGGGPTGYGVGAVSASGGRSTRGEPAATAADRPPPGSGSKPDRASAELKKLQIWRGAAVGGSAVAAAAAAPAAGRSPGAAQPERLRARADGGPAAPRQLRAQRPAPREWWVMGPAAAPMAEDRSGPPPSGGGTRRG